MTVNILFSAPPALWPEYEPLLSGCLSGAGLDFKLARDMAPEDVDYIVYAPDGGINDFTRFTRLKAVLSLWAGVEKIADNETLRVPLTRMVDEGLEQGMIEWVTGHVLRYHLGLDAHIVNPDHVWRPGAPPLARDRKVTILGMGALGSAVARTLVTLGFSVTGWSRSPHAFPGVKCHCGDAGLQAALDGAEIVVLLLPDTPSTRNTLNGRSLALLPRGARIINPGRGTLIDDDALLSALDNGQIGHATLDVFRTEPLPPDHPYWAHPNVTVTPHIASATRPKSAAKVICENIRRNEAGVQLLHVVDRTLGY